MGNPRLSVATPESRLYSFATHILSLPTPATGDRTARLALVGEGEDWRVRHAVDDYNKEGGFLLIAPFNTTEHTTEQLTCQSLQSRFGLCFCNPATVIIGTHTEHTRAQAEWFYQLHLKHNFQSAIIYASPYHVVRAYLTFLKYLLDQNCKLALFARPTPIPPHITVPESKLDSWDLIHGEAKRIGIYQDRGHVATVEELREYFAWLWNQPILTHY